MSNTKSPSLLILDLGTSTIKAVLTDLTFTDMSVESHPMPNSHSTDTFTLTSSFNPADLWKITSNLIAQCIKRAERRNLAIGAVGITSQRQGAVFLDKSGSELYMGPNLDLRAFFDGAAIDENHAEEIYSMTGHLPSFLFTPAKLQFFKREHPQLYQQISAVMTLGDWVAYKLTGELACCKQLANEAGLTDLSTQRWALNLLEMLGLRSDFLPRLTGSGELNGWVTQLSGEVTGLPTGIPVTVAGADSQCALIGMNIINPGETGIVAGWSVTTQMVTDRPILDTERRTWAGQHLIEDRWVLEANGGDAGNVYSWVRDLLFKTTPEGFSQMDQLALDLPRGADGTTAHLGPSVSNLSQPTFRQGGFLFPVPFTLTPFHRGNFVKATIENIAFSIREACELLETVSGQSLSSLALGGGMTKTHAFPKILTEVLGRPIILANTTNATALGAAIVTAPLIPSFSSLNPQGFKHDQLRKIIEPDPVGVAEYQDHYSRWIASADRLQSLR